MSAPKYAESIPAATRPVKLPSLVPGRAQYLAGVITGGALLTLALGLLVVGLAVSQ